MKISELSARSDVPVGTIKFYLRENLLPPGRRTSRTTAEYDEAHLERLRLIRALLGAGGLGVAAIRRVLVVLDSPQPDRLDVLAAAQSALTSPDEVVPPADSGGQSGPQPVQGRARGLLEDRGWPLYAEDPIVRTLEASWQACEDAGIDIDEETMGRYADASLEVARVDVATVPEGAQDAVRRVVLGTILLEPVLSALRLLAQRQVSVHESDRD